MSETGKQMRPSPGSDPAIRELEAAFDGEAEVFEIDAREPLPLSPRGGVWRVGTGTVEVFAVRGDGSGTRTHLTTASAGDLLLGTGAQGDGGLSLLAVARWGTRLLRLERSRLGEKAQRDPRLAEQLAEGLDRWVAGLAGGASHPPPPKLFEALGAGETLELTAEGRAVRPREEVVWVRQEEGGCRWLGQEGLEVATGERLPLPAGTWLTSTGPASVSGVAGVDLLDRHGADSGALWQACDRFHELLLRQLRASLEGREQRERERLERRIELDRMTLEGAYGRLATVLREEPFGQIALDEVANPLLAVSRRVGEVQGIEIHPPLASSRRGKASSQLQQIATASRVRIRRVLLRRDWWLRDNGPLVGFLAPEGEGQPRRPVALLPTSPRSYEMVDPVAGLRMPVDSAVNDALEVDAFMFYPPLPERPLQARDLVAAAFRGSRQDISTILLMGVGGGLLGLLVPLVTGQIFGQVIPGADRPQLLQLSLALLAAALASGLFQITRSLAVLRLGGHMDGSLQAAVWDRLLTMPVSFFRRFTVGDLAERSMGIDSIRELLTGHVVTSVLAAVFSLFSFGLLFYYSGRLAMVATLLVLLLLGISLLLTWLQLRHQRVLLRLQGKILSLLFGLINGLSKLRVSGAEQRAFALWGHRFAEQRQRAIRARRIGNVQGALNATYGVLSTLTIFAMVGLSSEISLSLGDFLAFNAAFGQFLSAALSMIAVFSGLLAIVPIYERLDPILSGVPETDPSKADAGELAGDVEFSHVSFRYRKDGPLILEDVSFRARPGEFIALVGPSGAGKSTCLRLVLGFEAPESGSIYFDGQDLSSLDLASVRRQIGVVLQSGRPMVGDIFTNIVGGSSLTLDDAWAAAEMSGLADDIRAMPMGMHTVISEGAGTFSGGQRQRLLIARAIVHHPRIVLFDEATSALDNRTQDVVSKSLERLKATRIVIAHRLSTIVGADRIYVIDGGRVAESGSYQELMAKGGVFTRLAARQIA